MRTKRFVAFTLIICMVTLLNGNAFAATTDTPRNSQRIDDQVELPQVVKGNDIFSQKTYNIDTEYDGIKRSADGYFAMPIETDTGTQMIPVGKVDINLADEDDVARVLSNDNIAPEIKERIASEHQRIAEEGYTVVDASLFSQELLPKNNTGGSGYSPQVTSTYYTYKGARMRSDKLVYKGLDTDLQSVRKGTSTKDEAKLIAEIAITVVSMSNKYIGFLTSGISLLQAFNKVYGTTWATGSTTDYCRVGLIYNKTDQWTYRQIGNDWYLGLCTQKAIVTNIASRQYYYNAAKRQGKTYPTNRSVSVTHKSPHFDSPWATAYQWCYDTKTEWMTWRCGGVTFYF